MDNNSGWAVRRVERFYLEIEKFNPFRGTSYIELLQRLKSKKAIVNIKKCDNKCFCWTIRVAKFPGQHGGHLARPRKYPTEDNFDFTGIEFPITLKQVLLVKGQNNLAISVFDWSNAWVPFFHVSDQPEEMERINLTLITTNLNSCHCYVSNLSCLLHPQGHFTHKLYHCECYLKR